ncbi:hypothetical protein PQX77_018780 [Marasmius sp. AFHP31]|nr:hypothetical protein PQX77_018780 [Marasmius sp. AFHP31]
MLMYQFCKLQKMKALEVLLRSIASLGLVIVEDIVTNPASQQEPPVVKFDLVNDEDGKEDRWRVHIFEWLHRLERDGCPFDTERNTVKVSSDSKDCLDVDPECYATVPSREVMQMATEIATANNQTRNAHERYRFEDCADGPWEYVLVPSERAKGGDVPRLYHRTSTGTTPITFDTDDFDSLPRFTSSAHPLFVMLHLIFNIPEPRHYSSAIEQQVFVPFISEDEDSETLWNCSHCRQTPDLDPACVSASDGCSLESIIDNTDAWPYTSPGAQFWAEGPEPSHDGESDSDDDLLLSYAPTKTPSEVMGELKEEDVYRERLANQVLADWCTARRKRARHSSWGPELSYFALVPSLSNLSLGCQRWSSTKFLPMIQHCSTSLKSLTLGIGQVQYGKMYLNCHLLQPLRPLQTSLVHLDLRMKDNERMKSDKSLGAFYTTVLDVVTSTTDPKFPKRASFYVRLGNIKFLGDPFIEKVMELVSRRNDRVALNVEGSDSVGPVQFCLLKDFRLCRVLSNGREFKEDVLGTELSKRIRDKEKEYGVSIRIGKPW